MNGNGIDDGASRSLVVVTGAGGFIGRPMVSALLQAGYRVRAVSRSVPAAADAPAAGGALHFARHPGVAPDADWHAVLAGAGAVVHLAGMAHLPLDTRQMRRRLREVNVLATHRLAQAAAAASVRHFVFMSSIKAVGDHSHGTALTEHDKPAPEDCYGIAKLAAERRLQRLVPAMRVVILRPPLVYGPGVGANFRALMGLVGRDLPLPFGSVHNRRSLLYVGNLAAAVLRCLERADVGSGTFHLSDDEAVSTPDLMKEIARAQGRSARLVGVPAGWLSLAARIVGRRAQADRLLGSLEVDNRRFCREFDWRPPFTLAQGLQATVAG
jgi:nucleoside-diphosphate-sugar epimerase